MATKHKLTTCLTAVKIYSDGGARGNPGPAGIGVVICDRDGKCQKFSRFIGRATNNQAEYQALIFALEKGRAMQAQEIECFLDSELITKQLNGVYKIKNKALKPLFEKVIALSIFFNRVSFRHIPREKNKEADKLVNQVIDAHA